MATDSIKIIELDVESAISDADSLVILDSTESDENLNTKRITAAGMKAYVRDGLTADDIEYDASNSVKDELDSKADITDLTPTTVDGTAYAITREDASETFKLEPIEGVQISTDSGNALSEHADGLYVAAGSIEISQEPGNIIRMEGDGLYAPPTAIDFPALTDEPFQNIIDATTTWDRSSFWGASVGTIIKYAQAPANYSIWNDTSRTSIFKAYPISATNPTGLLEVHWIGQMPGQERVEDHILYQSTTFPCQYSLGGPIQFRGLDGVNSGIETPFDATGITITAPAYASGISDTVAQVANNAIKDEYRQIQGAGLIEINGWNWDSTVTYAVGDQVNTKLFQSWICIAENSDIEPSDATPGYWIHETESYTIGATYEPWTEAILLEGSGWVRKTRGTFEQADLDAIRTTPLADAINDNHWIRMRDWPNRGHYFVLYHGDSTSHWIPRINALEVTDQIDQPISKIYQIIQERSWFLFHSYLDNVCQWIFKRLNTFDFNSLNSEYIELPSANLSRRIVIEKQERNFYVNDIHNGSGILYLIQNGVVNVTDFTADIEGSAPVLDYDFDTVLNDMAYLDTFIHFTRPVAQLNDLTQIYRDMVTQVGYGVKRQEEINNQQNELLASKIDEVTIDQVPIEKIDGRVDLPFASPKGERRNPLYTGTWKDLDELNAGTEISTYVDYSTNPDGESKGNFAFNKENDVVAIPMIVGNTDMYSYAEMELKGQASRTGSRFNVIQMDGTLILPTIAAWATGNTGIQYHQQVLRWDLPVQSAAANIFQFGFYRQSATIQHVYLRDGSSVNRGYIYTNDSTKTTDSFSFTYSGVTVNWDKTAQKITISDAMTLYGSYGRMTDFSEEIIGYQDTLSGWQWGDTAEIIGSSLYPRLIPSQTAQSGIISGTRLNQLVENQRALRPVTNMLTGNKLNSIITVPNEDGVYPTSDDNWQTRYDTGDGVASIAYTWESVASGVPEPGLFVTYLDRDSNVHREQLLDENGTWIYYIQEFDPIIAFDLQEDFFYVEQFGVGEPWTDGRIIDYYAETSQYILDLSVQNESQNILQDNELARLNHVKANKRILENQKINHLSDISIGYTIPGGHNGWVLQMGDFVKDTLYKSALYVFQSNTEVTSSSYFALCGMVNVDRLPVSWLNSCPPNSKTGSSSGGWQYGYYMLNWYMNRDWYNNSTGQYERCPMTYDQLWTFILSTPNYSGTIDGKWNYSVAWNCYYGGGVQTNPWGKTFNEYYSFNTQVDFTCMDIIYPDPPTSAPECSFPISFFDGTSAAVPPYSDGTLLPDGDITLDFPQHVSDNTAHVTGADRNAWSNKANKWESGSIATVNLADINVGYTIPGSTGGGGLRVFWQTNWKWDTQFQDSHIVFEHNDYWVAVFIIAEANVPSNWGGPTYAGAQYRMCSCTLSKNTTIGQALTGTTFWPWVMGGAWSLSSGDYPSFQWTVYQIDASHFNTTNYQNITYFNTNNSLYAVEVVGDFGRLQGMEIPVLGATSGTSLPSHSTSVDFPEHYLNDSRHVTPDFRTALDNKATKYFSGAIPVNFLSDLEVDYKIPAGDNGGGAEVDPLTNFQFGVNYSEHQIVWESNSTYFVSFFMNAENWPVGWYKPSTLHSALEYGGVYGFIIGQGQVQKNDEKFIAMGGTADDVWPYALSYVYSSSTGGSNNWGPSYYMYQDSANTWAGDPTYKINWFNTSGENLYVRKIMGKFDYDSPVKGSRTGAALPSKPSQVVDFPSHYADNSRHITLENQALWDDKANKAFSGSVPVLYMGDVPIDYKVPGGAPGGGLRIDNIANFQFNTNYADWHVVWESALYWHVVFLMNADNVPASWGTKNANIPPNAKDQYGASVGYYFATAIVTKANYPSALVDEIWGIVLASDIPNYVGASFSWATYQNSANTWSGTYTHISNFSLTTPLYAREIFGNPAAYQVPIVGYQNLATLPPKPGVIIDFPQHYADDIRHKTASDIAVIGSAITKTMVAEYEVAIQADVDAIPKYLDGSVTVTLTEDFSDLNIMGFMGGDGTIMILDLNDHNVTGTLSYNANTPRIQITGGVGTTIGNLLINNTQGSIVGDIVILGEMIIGNSSNFSLGGNTTLYDVFYDDVPIRRIGDFSACVVNIEGFSYWGEWDLSQTATLIVAEVVTDIGTFTGDGRVVDLRTNNPVETYARKEYTIKTQYYGSYTVGGDDLQVLLDESGKYLLDNVSITLTDDAILSRIIGFTGSGSLTINGGGKLLDLILILGNTVPITIKNANVVLPRDSFMIRDNSCINLLDCTVTPEHISGIVLNETLVVLNGTTSSTGKWIVDTGSELVISSTGTHTGDILMQNGKVIIASTADFTGTVTGAGLCIDNRSGNALDTFARPDDYVKLQSNSTQVIDSNIAMGKDFKLLGTKASGAEAVIAEYAIYNEGETNQIEQVEVGSETEHLNLNTNNDLMYDTHITVDTPDGKEIVAYTSDLPKSSVFPAGFLGIVYEDEEVRVETFGNLPGATKWIGGVIAQNGCIYGIPRNSTSILKIDLITDTATTFGNLPGTNKWYSGVIAQNGCIYGIPYDSTSILKITIKNGTPFSLNMCLSPYINKL
jgi:hypothetical protein